MPTGSTGTKMKKQNESRVNSPRKCDSGENFSYPQGERKQNVKNTVSVVLKCAECSTEQTIRRRKDRLKKKGHQKHLYCITCKRRTLHIEMGPEERW